MNYQILFNAMIKGSGKTLSIFFLTLLLSLPLGMVVLIGRNSRIKFVSISTKFYILLMRGTPLMLQLMFVFYGLKPLTGIQLPRFFSTIFAFSLNYAAYFAEIYRGGLGSIPKGQYEAAKVLGFSRRQTFTQIILPQLIQKILPSLGNECITLVKDTSLAQTIVVVELMKVTEKYASANVSAVPFAVAALFYLIMNAVVTHTFTKLEKKIHYN